MKNKGSRKATKHAKVINIDRWKGSPHRAEAPTPQAPRPQTPHSAREVSQKRPRGAGAGDLGATSPRPLFARLRAEHHYTDRNQQAHHAGPRGRRTSPACGSCRRPRKERQRKRGAMSRRTTNINEKIKRTREKQKEQENKTQRRSTAGNETKGSTADVAESMLSRSEDYVSPAREAESIVRRPKIHQFPS